MKHVSIDDDCDIPMECEEPQTVAKNSVKSPKTKSSKLCLDKGFVKKADDSFFNLTHFEHSSTQRVLCDNLKLMKMKDEHHQNPGWERDCRSPNPRYLGGADCFLKVSELERSKQAGLKDTTQSKRIQSSYSNDFKLAPLLIKVAKDPQEAELCSFSRGAKSPIHGEDPLRISFDENDEDSVSNGEDSQEIFVTMGDVSPGNN